MQKHPYEYYFSHNIFPPKDNEEGIEYFRRLLIHFQTLKIAHHKFRHFQKLSKKLDNEEILIIMPKYDRRLLWGLLEWICMYHVFDHYPDFAEYIHAFHDDFHYLLLSRYKNL